MQARLNGINVFTKTQDHAALCFADFIGAGQRPDNQADHQQCDNTGRADTRAVTPATGARAGAAEQTVQLFHEFVENFIKIRRTLIISAIAPWVFIISTRLIPSH